MTVDKVLLIFDRGLLDPKAYCADKSTYTQTLGMSESEALKEYDQVIHLVTTAIGAVEFYSGANNTARLESTELATKLDGITQELYKGIK